MHLGPFSLVRLNKKIGIGSCIFENGTRYNLAPEGGDAPKNTDGDFIDPNTGQIVPKEGPFDIGHKPGQEWKRRKKMHEAKGSTRKEVLDAENNPDLYQIEDPSSNRSHKFEKKD